MYTYIHIYVYIYIRNTYIFSSVQSLSCVRLFATPWTTARQGSLSIINSRSPPKPISIKSGMPSNHLILRRPLLLLPSIFPNLRVFSIESALCIRWPKYWSFSFSPTNEHPGLISFRMDWLDLLAVQGTRKSLQLFASGGQSIGISASVLPMNTQDWPPLGWTGWISLQSKGLSGVFSNTTVQKHQFFGTKLSL